MHVTEDDDRDRPAEIGRDLIEVDFVAGDGSLGGWLRLDVRPDLDTTWFLAAVLVAGEDPVVVIDGELPLPRKAFEFRAPGVWTEFCCETPLDHWTVGLEAFGLRVDPAETVSPATFGDRVPVGLDLDLDTTGAPDGDGAAFSIEIRVHGEVLLDERSWELEATGVRRRITSGLRSPDPFVGEPVAAVTVEWPDTATARPLRRGWVAGNRPGWVDLPLQSGV